MYDGVSTVIPAYTITKKILAASLNVDNSSNIMRFHPVSNGLFCGNCHTGFNGSRSENSDWYQELPGDRSFEAILLCSRLLLRHSLCYCDSKLDDRLVMHLTSD